MKKSKQPTIEDKVLKVAQETMRHKKYLETPSPFLNKAVLECPKNPIIYTYWTPEGDKLEWHVLGAVHNVRIKGAETLHDLWPSAYFNTQSSISDMFPDNGSVAAFVHDTSWDKKTFEISTCIHYDYLNRGNSFSTKELLANIIAEKYGIEFSTNPQPFYGKGFYFHQDFKILRKRLEKRRQDSSLKLIDIEKLPEEINHFLKAVHEFFNPSEEVSAAMVIDKYVSILKEETLKRTVKGTRGEVCKERIARYIKEGLDNRYCDRYRATMASMLDYLAHEIEYTKKNIHNYHLD